MEGEDEEVKKVYVVAYDGVNLGDDLFIRTIVNRYPHVKFYMWSDLKNREIFRCLTNLKIIDKNGKLPRLLERIRPSLAARYRNWMERRCRAMVYIGGSIFIEYENWKQILNWWNYRVEQCDFFVLGANFGPYHTEAYREEMGQIYAQMKDVCFRDRYSYGLFREINTVRYAPDILLAHSMPQVPVDEKQIFVSVINCAARDGGHGLTAYDADYVKNMARLLEKYCREGYRPVISSFCEVEGDEEAIRKILKTMDPQLASMVQVLNYDGTNAQKLCEAIAGSAFVVATRFHATILAIVAGRPVLPVIYSDKTLHVLEDLGIRDPLIDIRSSCDYTTVKPVEIAVNRQQLALDAQKHFEKLDEILR